MGVQGLWPLLEPVGRRVNIEALTNKRLAVGDSRLLFSINDAVSGSANTNNSSNLSCPLHIRMRFAPRSQNVQSLQEGKSRFFHAGCTQMLLRRKEALIVKRVLQMHPSGFINLSKPCVLLMEKSFETLISWASSVGSASNPSATMPTHFWSSS